MLEFFSLLLDTEGFPPRRNCGVAWTDEHAWLHIVSDVAIFIAYLAIPIVLTFFVMRRKDVPFLPIFWLFAAFILSCGVGHAVEATIFFHPWYRLSGLVKLITAIVSLATVFALLPVLPHALSLPGLASVNERLTEEVAVRRATEEKLRHSYEEMRDFTHILLDREDRIIELKHEVNDCFKKLGREPRYLLEATDR